MEKARGVSPCAGGWGGGGGTVATLATNTPDRKHSSTIETVLDPCLGSRWLDPGLIWVGKSLRGINTADLNFLEAEVEGRDDELGGRGAGGGGGRGW